MNVVKINEKYVKVKLYSLDPPKYAHYVRSYFCKLSRIYLSSSCLSRLMIVSLNLIMYVVPLCQCALTLHGYMRRITQID